MSHGEGLNNVEPHQPTGGRGPSPWQQALAVFLEGIPALFWRLDIIKNEIIFLNDHSVVGLTESIPLVLKKLRHAREVVLEQDLDRFFRCLNQIRKQSASALERIKNDESFFRWIAILGMSDPERLSSSIGLLMHARGRWMDNVMIERLWWSLKYECVYLRAFETGGQARNGIGDWFDYYNSSRPHSSLGGRTPDEAYLWRQEPGPESDLSRLASLAT